MTKFLLITGLVLFLLFSMAKYILRASLWLLGWQIRREVSKSARQEQKRPKEGHIEIVHTPDKRNRTASDYTDGEYIDFEEVK